MNLKNTFWFFEKALTPEFCDKIIKLGIKKNPSLGVIKKYQNKKITSKDLKDLKKTRNSNTAFIDDAELYKKIDEFFLVANRNAGWNFEFDYYESTQFTVYKKGQHYNWHADSNGETYSMDSGPSFKGKIRKLSATIALNDSKEYKGGDFLIDDSNPLKKKIYKVPALKNKGSVVVFPSHLHHKVSPVTKGTRYSLVIWALGFPWR
mgnify:FL=1